MLSQLNRTFVIKELHSHKHFSCISTRETFEFMYLSLFCLFFFSSRRRHTRFKCDWSSDVCSSDLKLRPCFPYQRTPGQWLPDPFAGAGSTAAISPRRAEPSPAAPSDHTRRPLSPRSRAHRRCDAISLCRPAHPRTFLFPHTRRPRGARAESLAPCRARRETVRWRGHTGVRSKESRRCP